MTLALNDRVKETTTVTGTGTATLLGATTGFQSFAVVGNANTTYYCIADQGGANWEVGLGTYTSSGNTLARTTVLASSNAGALVVFTTGVKDVFVTYPSEKGVWYDASGNVLFTGTTTAANLAYTGTLTGSTGILNIGSGQVYKDASGNVGIGTSSPGGDATNRSVTASGSGSASFNSSCGTVVSIYAATSGNGLLGTSSNHSLVFNTNNTERMRIDSLGNVGIGISSPSSYGKFVVAGTSASQSFRVDESTSGYQYAQGVDDTGIYYSNNSTARGYRWINSTSTATKELMRIDSSGRVGIGGVPSAVALEVISTGAILVAKGTTAQQPTGVAGYLRFNTTTAQFEGHNGTVWASVGGSVITNDTTTATEIYPLCASATSGTALNVYTSNTKYVYTPSTGELESPELLASNGMVLNNSTVSSSYTIPVGYNATATGPMNVASGVVITIPSGSRWVVL